KAKRGILNCTVAALKAVHRGHTVAGSLILVASPGERQSAEFLRKAREFAARLGLPRRRDGDPSTSIFNVCHWDSFSTTIKSFISGPVVWALTVAMWTLPRTGRDIKHASVE